MPSTTTRGVYKGFKAESGLTVSVTVCTADAPRPEGTRDSYVVRSRTCKDWKDLQEFTKSSKKQ